MSATKIVLAGVLAIVVLASTASAATPIKGAVYKGRAGDSAKVRIKVSSTGKRLTFVLSCYGSEAVRITGVKITNGRFTAYKPGFAARGRFATRRKAKGSISGNACFLSSSQSFRATKT